MSASKMSGPSTTITETTAPQATLTLRSPPADAPTQESSAGNPLAFGGYNLAGIPSFLDFESHRQWIREHMAAAFRSLAREGLSEGTAGHISVRDPEHQDRFWMNPLGVHFGMMKASDMVLVDYEGAVVGGNMVAVNAAGFKIHSAVHKARPDVHAAVHAHGVAGRAWSAFGKPLDMLTQDSCLFYKSHSVYNNFGGIVFEEAEAKRLANSLGDCKAMILQNHGLITVGQTVDEACYIFQLMERLCDIQLKVEAAAKEGLEKIIISDEAAKYTLDMSTDPESIWQEWQPLYKYELWKSKGEIKL